MKKLIVSILALTLLLGLACSAHADTLKLATSTMPGHVTTETLLHFAERAAALSEGRIQIEVCDATVNGDESTYLAQLESGEIAMARLSPNFAKGLVPGIQAFALPYMFANSDELWTVLSGEVGKAMLGAFDDAGLHALGFLDAGSRSFYTVEPINALEDFAGRKIRVQQVEPMVSMITCLGAEPVNVAAFDLAAAFENGSCAGAENTLASIYMLGHHTAAPYITLDNHTCSVDTLCVSADVWAALSEADQAALAQAMDEAMAYNREAWAAANAETEKALADEGAIITTPDAAVLASFHDAMAPLYAQYEDTLGAWVAQINAALGK